MHKLLFVVLALFCSLQLAVPQGGFAQESAAGDIELSAIAVIDQNRLFEETRFGRNATLEFQRLSAQLTEENTQITTAFEAEEKQLADERATLSKEAFSEQAQDFDARVKASRAAQDQKLRELNQFVLQQRATFFEAARPVLLQIMQEKNIDAILTREAILLFRDNIDITDEAIAILDQRLPIE